MTVSLLRIADEILGEYPFKPRKAALVHASESKAVWKVNAGEKTYGLKRLKYGKDRMLFAVQAQKHLAEAGAPVADIVRTRQGELYAEKDGRMFLLYEWTDGRRPNFAVRSDLRQAVRLLARFHLASSGFRPAIPCTESSKLGKWPGQYETMRGHLEEWKDAPAIVRLSGKLKTGWKEAVGMADEAIGSLQASAYRRLVRGGGAFLCHQDYSEGNLLLRGNGGTILDMDSVTFDFPARDLRKLILKRMLVRGKWDGALFGEILRWYGEVHPLSDEQMRLVLIDLSFPHLLHETAKDPCRGGPYVPAARLLAAARIEKEKRKGLAPWLDKFGTDRRTSG